MSSLPKQPPHARFERLDETLDRTWGLLRVRKQVRNARAVAAFADAAGHHFARNCRALEVTDDGALIVAVNSPAWAQELRHASAEIRARIERLAPNTVTSLRSRVVANLPPAPTPPVEPAPPMRATPVDLADCEAQLTEIASRNPELAHALRQAVSRARYWAREGSKS